MALRFTIPSWVTNRTQFVIRVTDRGGVTSRVAADHRLSGQGWDCIEGTDEIFRIQGAACMGFPERVDTSCN